MSERVPEGWAISNLDDAIDILSGFPFKSSEFTNDPSDFGLIRIRNLLGQELETFYSGEYSDDFVVQVGDILIGMDGDFHIVKWKSKNALLNQRICKLVPKQGGFDINFVHYFLIPELQKIHNQTTATTVKHLSVKDIREVEQAFPPLNEQKKIASILTSVDEVIETTQKQIDKLQDLKKATMNELLTKGIGHTEFKDSELGRIPKSWEVKSLAKICEVSSSKRVMQSDYADEGVPFYRSKEIIIKSKGDKVQSVLYIPEEQFLNLASKFGAPASGDILITAVGTIGVCYLVGQEKFYFKDGNLLWLKRIKKLMPSFLSVYLSIQSTRERIIEISGGSSQSALTIEKLSDFLVPIPSQCEQDKFSKIAKSLGERIDSQKQKLAQTQSLKKSLMQDLLTGKVRVKVN